MMKAKYISMILLLAAISSPLFAQSSEYDEEALIADGYKTGSDLVTSGNSVLSNGGTVDENGSNKYCGDIFIPEGITTLQKRDSGTQGGAGTFQYSYITTATLPASVTEIETAAFSDCIYLSNIYVSDDNERYFDQDGVVYEWLVKDEDDPFNPETNQFQLVAVPGAKATVTILEGTTKIGPCALDGCSKITAVIIPATVTEIHQYAFTGTNLASLTCMSTTPPAVYGMYSDWGWIDFNANSHGFYEMNVTVIKVPYGTADEYKAANRWKNFNIEEMPKIEDIIEEEVQPQTTYVQHIEKIVLSDSENYTRDEAHEVGGEIRRETKTEGINTIIDIYYSSAVTYERVFKNDKWQALYAPFNITYNDFRSDMLEIAEIKSVTEYVDADNNVTFFYLTAEVLDDGDVIPAHTPCIIRSITANEAGVGRDIDITKGTDSGTVTRILEAAQSNTMELQSANGNVYKLVGQYEKRTSGEIEEQDGAGATEIYAMAGGSLKQAAGSNVTLGAYRWYLTVEPAPANRTMQFKFGTFQNTNTTSIDNVVIEVENRENNLYYDLNGRPVETPEKGIYIYKGKKIVF